MTQPGGATMIVGRVGRTLSNALTMTFSDGPDSTVATAVQSGGDGVGRKLGVLFGFANGGTGTHVLTYPDGARVLVRSGERKPTVVSGADGVEIATVHRGDVSTAVLAGGAALLRFVPDPVEPMSADLFRLVLRDPDGADVGRLDVVRRVDGWSIGRALDAAWETYVWWDHAGQALPIPVLGTRLTLARPVAGATRDVLLGACVDLAIGLRPYIAAMN